MLKFDRDSKKTGEPMLVDLPKGGDWKNSGEGGLAFFLVVSNKDHLSPRQVCIARGVEWPRQDVALPAEWSDFHLIDAGLLIGSTTRSLFSDSLGEYFQPTLEDLTDEGKRLYKVLKSLYGDVEIVTLLDT